jgi:hypothetical protein
MFTKNSNFHTVCSTLRLMETKKIKEHSALFKEVICEIQIIINPKLLEEIEFQHNKTDNFFLLKLTRN